MNTTASRPEQGRRYKYLLGGARRGKEQEFLNKFANVE